MTQMKIGLMEYQKKKLSINADKWNEKNQLVKAECPKYGIEYIDTSHDREKTLGDILIEIGKDVTNPKVKRDMEVDER